MERPDPESTSDEPATEPGRPVPAVDIRDLLAERARGVLEAVPPLGWVAVVAVALVAIAAGWLVASRGGSEARLDPDTVPRATPHVAPVTTAAPSPMVVHVAGAVARPGVYHLDPHARVADAVEAAGGPVGEADLDRLNLAAPLADGQRVHVPLVGEEVPEAVGPGVGAESAEPALVDLNTADQAALETLPGVGPTIAGAIIARRIEQPFSTVEDLLDVAGIGPTRLERLRPLVTVTPVG